MEKVDFLHEKIFTIDTHTDTPLQLMHGNLDIGVKNEPRKTRSKIDLPRMKEGGLDAAFWAVFIGQGPLTSKAHEAAKLEAFDIIKQIKTTIAENSDLAELAYFSGDAYRIKQTGKRAIYMGMENGYPVGDNLSLVDEFYKLGVRYITLCHNGDNNICDSATDENKTHNGLSSFGEKVVHEMNKLGMIIDVSHMSDDSFYDVINISKAPVVATHSCARALHDHPRNMSDDMIKKLSEKGGVIQVTMVGSFVKELAPNPERDSAFSVFRKKYENRENLTQEDMDKRREEYFAIEEKYPRELATVSDFVDHIDHIVQLVGIDYVGVGSDFDGGGQLDGCFDVSEMKNITVELLKRGYDNESITKIWGGNFMRVFKEVEKVAKELN